MLFIGACLYWLIATIIIQQTYLTILISLLKWWYSFASSSAPLYIILTHMSPCSHVHSGVTLPSCNIPVSRIGCSYAMKAKDGSPIYIYLHCFPARREVWAFCIDGWPLYIVAVWYIVVDAGRVWRH